MNKFMEMFKDKNVVHVSDSDLDGVSCILEGEVFIEPICASYYPYMNADRGFKDIPMDIVELADVVLFTDIVPTVNLYNELKTMGKVIIICDHHETSKIELNELNIEHYYYIENNEQCGAMILFNNIFEGQRPPRVVKEYINLVSIYDTWKEKSELWKEAGDLFDYHIGSVNYQIRDNPYFANANYLKNMKMKFKFNDRFEYTKNDLDIIQDRRNKRQAVYEKCLSTLEKRIDNKGTKYLYVEMTSGISQIGNRFLTENPDYTYVAIWNTYSLIKADHKISLRSVEGFAVNEIASLWGGGGHKNSASFHFESTNEFEQFKSGKVHLI